MENTLYDNHERSFIGKRWFAYGESEEKYILINHEVVTEDDEYIYIQIKEYDRLIFDGLLSIRKDEIENIYPIQKEFATPMTIEEAEDVLRNLFF